MAQTSDPAFPVVYPDGSGVDRGMSLRDYFAAQALSAVIDVYRYDNGGGIGAEHLPRNVAAHAYRIADAMLKAREE